MLLAAWAISEAAQASKGTKGAARRKCKCKCRRGCGLLRAASAGPLQRAACRTGSQAGAMCGPGVRGPQASMRPGVTLKTSDYRTHWAIPFHWRRKMAVPPVRRHNHDQHEAGKSSGWFHPLSLYADYLVLGVCYLQRTPSPCLLEQVWRHVLHTHIAWLNKDCTFTLVTTRPAEPL